MISRQNPIYPKNWKEDFLKQPENSWFCDIPDDYIIESFNLTGLEDKFSYFDQELQVLVNKKSITKLADSIRETVWNELPILYGSIHARFIISPDGINQVKEKYNRREYGFCPRISCNKEPLLPIGITSELKKNRVKGFCPKCRSVYRPNPVVEIDGGFFGPNCPHILVEELNLRGKYREYKPYVRSAFGYHVYDEKIHGADNISN